jgi:hypothetical protein
LHHFVLLETKAINLKMAKKNMGLSVRLFLTALLSLLALQASCATATCRENTVIVPPDRPAVSDKPLRASLPFANGQSFESLDDYLSFRRRLGETGRSFYEELSPGVYRLVTGRRLPGSSERLYTRAELLKKFNFNK